MLRSPHGIHRLPDDRWRGRGLIEGITCQQNMAGRVFLCQCREFVHGVSTRLAQPHSNIFGKSTKGFAQMQVRGVNESYQGICFPNFNRSLQSREMPGVVTDTRLDGMTLFVDIARTDHT